MKKKHNQSKAHIHSDEWIITETKIKEIASAIIRQAVHDWKKTKDPKEKKEIEAFMTDFSGTSRYIIQRLKKEEFLHKPL